MNVLAICGSASSNSANLQLLNYFGSKCPEHVVLEIWDSLQQLPLFNAEQALGKLPEMVVTVHEKIRTANLIVISTPEYIFSVPAGLKNLLEWCVSTSVFSGKQVALLVASANGEKAFEELKLILRTIEAVLPDEQCFLIQGVRGKIDERGAFMDKTVEDKFDVWIGNLVQP